MKGARRVLQINSKANEIETTSQFTIKLGKNSETHHTKKTFSRVPKNPKTAGIKNPLKFIVL